MAKSQESVNTMDSGLHAVDENQGVSTLTNALPTMAITEDENSQDETSIPGPGWDLSQCLSRKTYVKSLEWKIEDKPGTILCGLDIMRELLTSDIVSMPFERFTYFRCKDVEMNVNISGSRFLSGRLAMFFIPTQRDMKAMKLIKPYDGDLRKCFSLNPVFLDPATGSPGVLKIKFRYFKEYLELGRYDCLGQFYIVVFNKLRAASTAPNSAQLKLYFSVNGAEFKVPRVNSTPPSVKPESKEDKLPIPTTSDSLVVKRMGPLSYGSGTDTLDRLQLYPEKEDIARNNLSGITSDLSISDFTKHKLSFLETIDWTPEAETGSILWKRSVGPFASFRQTGMTYPEFETFLRGFENWRGDICFVFEVVCSQFHEGILDITYHPEDVAPETLVSGLSQYAASLNIHSSGNIIAVNCPYLSTSKWKRIFNGGKTTSWANGNARFIFDFFTGTVALRVGSKLRSPASVSPSAAINIYMCGGSNFQVGRLGNNNRSVVISPRGARIVKDVKPESKVEEPFSLNGDPFFSKFLRLGPKEPCPQDAQQFVEIPDSIYTICKRYSPIADIDLDVPMKEGRGVTTLDIAKLLHTGLSAQSYYTSMFRNFRGSINFKISVAAASQVRPVSGNITLISPLSNNISDAQSLFGYQYVNVPNTLIPCTHFQENTVAEFSVPHVNMYPSGLNIVAHDEYIPTTDVLYFDKGILYIYVESEQEAVHLKGYLSFGDDFELGTYLGVPNTEIVTAPNGERSFPDLW